MKLGLDYRPRLVRAARLRLDAQTQRYILLSPERGLLLNDSAAEVVLRCTGELTVRQIVDTVLEACTPEQALGHDRVEDDVMSLLVALYKRNLLSFEVS